MLNLINETVLLQMFPLGEQFRNNQPFPHIVMDQFFKPDFADELLKSFPPFDPEKAKNELGLVGGKAVHVDIPNLGEPFKKLDDMVQSDHFLKFLSGVTGIPELLYDPSYEGGGTHENLHGQDLDPHADFNFHPHHHWHRRLNLLIYLNEEWEESWGGCLELHSNPWNQDENQVKQFSPTMNRAILFETSERSWHGFKKIQLPDSKRSRKSIALYFYTDAKDSVSETPRHSTFYVPRPIPETLKPGYILTENDINELKILLIRRDTWIKYLYERELMFSDQAAKIPVIERSATQKLHNSSWIRDLAHFALNQVHKFVSPKRDKHTEVSATKNSTS